ncbi:unnamed protein product, partial [Prorocentrum cordatum]
LHGGVKEAVGVCPCALALSSAAIACLGSQDIWGAPVPLGLTVTAAVLAGGLVALLMLVAQAVCRSCYVTCELALACAFALRQTSLQMALDRLVQAPLESGHRSIDMMRVAPRRRRSFEGLKPGHVVCVSYGVDGEPYDRLILAVVDHCCYSIWDIYAETIGLEFFGDFREGGPRGGLPAGLGAARGQPVHRFSTKHVGQELQDLFEQGRAKAAVESSMMGILEDVPGPPPALAGTGASAAPPLPPPAGSRPAGSSSELVKWVCVALSAQEYVGNTFMLAAQHHIPSDSFVGNGSVDLYDRGLRGDPAVLYRVEVGEQESEVIELFRRRTKRNSDVEGTDTPLVRAPGAPSSEDARTLPVLRDSAGRRFENMKSVANSSEMCGFDDWVLEGPRSVLDLAKEIAGQAAGPFKRLSTWKHENELQDVELNAVTHGMLSEIIVLATTLVQLDVSDLAGMGSLCLHSRHTKQRIKKKQEAGKDFDLQGYYLGRARRTGGAWKAPELQKWVAEWAARESSILKEEKEAAEERTLACAPKRSPIALLNSAEVFAVLLSVWAGRPSQAQSSALDGILRAVTDDRPPDPLPAPEAALQELLGTEALDYASEDLSVVAPYDRGLVSWPDTAGSVDLLDVLPDPDRQEVIDGPRALLLRAEEEPPAACKVYWDKTLKADRGEYTRFVQDLLNRGMVELRTRREFEVGIFFVRKKSGKLRLIVDARSVNQNLRRPTSIQLASTAAMVGLEAEPGDMLEFSIQDIADCFYQFKVPDYMAPWFGMRPVRAGEVGAKTVQGEPVLAGAWVYPCLRVLPMGFSWAMRWTQQAHRELLRRAGLGGIESELVDRQVPPTTSATPVPRIVYVDNEVFVSSRPGASADARQQAAKKMSSVGLPLHEVEEGKHVVEALGLELDGIKLRRRLASSKRWRLVHGTRALLRRRLVAGRDVEKLIGHFTHAMLLNRPALCIFRAAYDFARRHYRAPSLLWPSVRQELQNAMHIMPLLAVQFDMPWSGLVTCSDATLRGYAVQEADFPVSEVKQVGRWSERWRFKACSSASGAGWCRRAWHPSAVGGPAPERRLQRRSGRVPDAVVGPRQSGGGPGYLDRATARLINEASPIPCEAERIAGTGGPTVLEQENATAKTTEDCERKRERFFGFCSISGLALDTYPLLREALVEYMDLLFAQGGPCSGGAKLLAAVGHRWPRLHHAMRLLKLPREAKALQGWRHLLPLVIRAPVLWAAVAPIALALVRRRQPLAALAVVLAADAYLRPGELLSLQANRVVPAQSEAGSDYRFASLEPKPEEELLPTKTKGFNDSILLDGTSKRDLGVLVKRLARQKSFSAELLFPRWAAVSTAMFERAAAVQRHEKSSRVMRRTATLQRDYQLLMASSTSSLEAGLRFKHDVKFESRCHDA